MDAKSCRKQAASPEIATGRWTVDEHAIFVAGLREHGKEWKKIAQLIPTRTVVQIRTHAQKYFQKLAKMGTPHPSACRMSKAPMAEPEASRAPATSKRSRTGQRLHARKVEADAVERTKTPPLTRPSSKRTRREASKDSTPAALTAKGSSKRSASIKDKVSAVIDADHGTEEIAPAELTPVSVSDTGRELFFALEASAAFTAVPCPSSPQSSLGRSSSPDDPLLDFADPWSSDSIRSYRSDDTDDAASKRPRASGISALMPESTLYTPGTDLDNPFGPRGAFSDMNATSFMDEAVSGLPSLAVHSSRRELGTREAMPEGGAHGFDAERFISAM